MVRHYKEQSFHLMAATEARVSPSPSRSFPQDLCFEGSQPPISTQAAMGLGIQTIIPGLQSKWKLVNVELELALKIFLGIRVAYYQWG